MRCLPSSYWFTSPRLYILHHSTLQKREKSIRIWWKWWVYKIQHSGEWLIQTVQVSKRKEGAVKRSITVSEGHDLNPIHWLLFLLTFWFSLGYILPNKTVTVICWALLLGQSMLSLRHYRATFKVKKSKRVVQCQMGDDRRSWDCNPGTLMATLWLDLPTVIVWFLKSSLCWREGNPVKPSLCSGVGSPGMYSFEQLNIVCYGLKR